MKKEQRNERMKERRRKKEQRKNEGTRKERGKNEDMTENSKLAIKTGLNALFFYICIDTHVIGNNFVRKSYEIKSFIILIKFSKNYFDILCFIF